MGQLLGIGVTHSPNLMYPDEHMADILKGILGSGKVPADKRDPSNWPMLMKKEWGDDEGLLSAKAHREALVHEFRRIRQEIDLFQPDFAVIFGDDQYENFREDLVPQFCVLNYGEISAQPFLHDPPFLRASKGEQVNNFWDEPKDQKFSYIGHVEGGGYIIDKLNHLGFDVAYSFKPLHHHGIAHAFANTLNYLDYDRQGFAYPVVPFHVNCYGKSLLRGGFQKFVSDNGLETPNGPTPARCFEMGMALGAILESSPWKVAVIGSSSWSHASLTSRTGWLHPDFEFDQERYDELMEGRHSEWRNLSIDEIENAGQMELRNWICLAGAMASRKPKYTKLIETHLFNSNKCFAIF